MSFPNNFMINPVGVTTKKKTNTITIGEMKLPRNIPNLNHSLLKGVKNFELIIPNIKKISTPKNPPGKIKFPNK